MITHVQFFGPHYAAKLPLVGSKKFTFKNEPGITILFGPNGCGKSTIIKALGAGSFTSGGWSHAPEPGIWEHKGEDPFDVKKKLGIDVKWDGTPTMMYDGIASASTASALDMSSDGINEENAMDDNIKRVFSRPSSGQWKEYRLNQVLSGIQNPPDLTKPLWQNFNSTWSSAGTGFADMMKEKKPTGTVTLLMDEPDATLSIINIAQLYKYVLPHFVKKFKAQIIVATHSLFALATPDCDVIDMESGYVDECKKIASELLQFKKEDREMQKEKSK